MATTWTIAIDWNRDGDYNDTYEDVTSRVIEAKWVLGMQKTYQDIADNSVMNLVLDNSDKKYSPENASSPLYGSVKPFKPIRIQSYDGTTTRTHWVGWAMSLFRDEVLVTDALCMALARRQLPQPANLIQHTDRGSQYTADDYLALLKAHGILVSMSDKGNPYDNAMMESFFSTLRAELTDLERFAPRQAAQTALFEFIEVFYHRQRLHSSLGYRSPLAFETAHLS